jgi:hypothetical protein
MVQGVTENALAAQSDKPGRRLTIVFRLAVGGLKEQLDRFLQVFPGSLDRIALARDINFRAQTDISVAFALNNGRELLNVLH